MTQENFPVAPRILPRRYRADLDATYRFARYVDDIGDREGVPGDRPAAREAELRALGDEVHLLYDGGSPATPEVAGLADLAGRGVPMDAWLRLVEANLWDQQHSRYETFEDLLSYCTLSANPVGEVVLHIFGQADPDRVLLSDRICTGLQLVEHWQDLREDYRNGRVYLPAQDMRRFGVGEDDLGRRQATQALTELVAYETDRALAWLNSGAALVPALRGWARLAVGGYLNGGRAAAECLRRAGHDPMPAPPKPSTRQVAASWLRATVRSPG